MQNLKNVVRISLGLILISIISGCAILGDKDGKYIYAEAHVDSISINIMESFPVQVSVLVDGFLSDGCTHLHNISQARNNNTFEIMIETRRLRDDVCIQVISPFQETITLDVLNLPAGIYTVNVNGVSDTFELQIDNTPFS